MQRKPILRGYAAIRTRMMLVSALVLVIVLVTGGSLVIVRDRVRRQAAENLSADLTRSLATFEYMQRQRRDALLHENALLADLPSLKALMTTRDQKTVADGAPQFWRVSGSDLFALAGSDGRVLAVDLRGGNATPDLSAKLQRVMADAQAQYLVADGQLFDLAVRPLYFGSEKDGTLLGFVITGYAVNRAFVNVLSQTAAVQATFLAASGVVSSTLTPLQQQQLAGMVAAGRTAPLTGGRTPAVIALGRERYLATSTDLSREAAGPLQLVVLRSLAASEQAAREINQLVFLVGLAALFFGTVLMLVLAKLVTRPLEQLAVGVRAFGVGNSRYELPTHGTKEVQELSLAFARMRREIAATNHALLEAEKLATIGRMASSISHDLRHYLAAVYANAEFLSSPRLSEAERMELFAEIRAAVLGTTDLIDSLLTFSHAGPVLRTRESLLPIAERAIAMLRAHPETGGVAIHLLPVVPSDTEAPVDAKKVERALYNLLLNACQSARIGPGMPKVQVELTSTATMVFVTVTDSGAGVPEAIRETLFQPFVSEGKQNGTGLGLTLAHAIAEEHGGAVRLKSTGRGETVFEMTLQRNLSDSTEHTGDEKQLQPPSKSRSGRFWQRGMRKMLGFSLAVVCAGGAATQAQSPGHGTASPQPGVQESAVSLDTVSEQLRRLASLVEQQGEQLRESREEILALREQVIALQAHRAGESPPEQQGSETAAARLAEQVAVLREQQEVQHAEVATHEQTKVESASKYPVTLTGLIVANAFTNIRGVDIIQSPDLAVPGTSSVGITLRQTVMGLDARGPHLAGASTHADVRVDFFGGGPAASPAGYGASDGLLRLRTAHAVIDWTHAQAFVEMDRPIVSPNVPTSLAAVAQPALAWSGNLWNWTPQFGGEYRQPLGSNSHIEVAAALVDVPDPPAYAGAVSAGANLNASSYAEQSRKPGSEMRVGYTQGTADTGARLGMGGYFSPHEAKGYFHYDAWAATLDYRLPLGRWLEATGAFYRGLALGGLGGGAYKDDVFALSPTGAYTFKRPLDAVGGWSQLKLHTGQRLEFNADFGLDNAFARELRPYAVAGSGTYANLVRNATFFSNAIYSPTAYTLFSFEYRRLDTTPVTGARSASDVFGLAAGYKF